MSALHDSDFYTWSRAQAARLRRLAELRLNDLPELDWREKNPNLKSKAADEFADAYEPARLKAASETGLTLVTFPEPCPFSREQVEDEGFWPGKGPDDL